MFSENGTSASSAESGELAMQSIASSESQDDSNKERLLHVESENSCTKNTSPEETEEVEIFISDVDDKGIEDDRNCCGCKSCWCSRYRCCQYFRNSKIAVLLR